MKRGKRFLSLILLTVLTLTLTVPVQAEGLDEAGQVVDGSLLTVGDSVEDTYTSRARGVLLNFGSTRLVWMESGKVALGGYTACHVTCEKLRFDVTIQKYQNGTWYDHRTFKSTEYNDHLLAKEYVINVTPGYYYRLKGVHIAYQGNNSESVSTLTDGLYIS